MEVGDEGSPVEVGHGGAKRWGLEMEEPGR